MPLEVAFEIKLRFEVVPHTLVKRALHQPVGEHRPLCEHCGELRNFIAEGGILGMGCQPLEALGYQLAYKLDLTLHPYPMSQTINYASGVLGMEPPMTFQNPNDRARTRNTASNWSSAMSTNRNASLTPPTLCPTAHPSDTNTAIRLLAQAGYFRSVTQR